MRASIRAKFSTWRVSSAFSDQLRSPLPQEVLQEVPRVAVACCHAAVACGVRSIAYRCVCGEIGGVGADAGGRQEEPASGQRPVPAEAPSSLAPEAPRPALSAESAAGRGAAHSPSEATQQCVSMESCGREMVQLDYRTNPHAREVSIGWKITATRFSRRTR